MGAAPPLIGQFRISRILQDSTDPIGWPLCIMSAASLRCQLQRSGYAMVHAPQAAASCTALIDRFRASEMRRYPAVDAIDRPPSGRELGEKCEEEMARLYSVSFNHMYSLAVRELSTIAPGVLPLDEGASSLSLRAEPFMDGTGQREPFACEARWCRMAPCQPASQPATHPLTHSPTHPPTSSELPYKSSFASAFNYDRGFLNIHEDRGLLTCVFGYSPSAAPDGSAADDRVRLWCQPHDDPNRQESCHSDAECKWLDLDAATARFDGAGGSQSVVFFVGAQLEELTEGRFRAIPHACRVDPTDARLDTRLPTHPGAPATGNRKSFALVLAT